MGRWTVTCVLVDVAAMVALAVNETETRDTRVWFAMIRAGRTMVTLQLVEPYAQGARWYRARDHPMRLHERHRSSLIDLWEESAEPSIRHRPDQVDNRRGGNTPRLRLLSASHGQQEMHINLLLSTDQCPSSKDPYLLFSCRNVHLRRTAGVSLPHGVMWSIGRITRRMMTDRLANPLTALVRMPWSHAKMASSCSCVKRSAL